MQFCVTLRGPTSDDVDTLFQMISQSTGHMTKLVADSLKDDIVGPKQCDGPTISSDDPSIEFDPSLLASNKPIAEVVLAEVENKLIGYLIFHYHYSPWTGHCAFIDDIFIMSDYRNKGIARQLIEEVVRRAKKENLTSFLFKTINMSLDLKEKIMNLGAIWYRNDSVDWSVYRLSFHF